MYRIPSAGALLAITFSPLCHATHGMNMDAYGAKAGGMGGAAMAYDSGNSAVMNNPATLGLKPDGRNDFGIGLTLLKPDVKASHPAAGESKSDGDAYYMPSVSWTQRRGDWTYGFAVLAQGGMGTEYGAGSALFAGGLSLLGTPAPLSGEEIRSEVGFGRLMFPLAWQATDRLSVAGQVDFVWATMDVQMDIDGRSFGRLVAGEPGVGSASGSLVTAFQGAMGAGQITNVNYARFDFSDGDDFSGAAKGHGAAFKLGMVYRATDTLNLGATYHSKTRISDLKAGSATVQVGIDTPGGTFDVPVTGKIRVIDFQWPETFGIGLAWQATPALMLVADLKRLRWSEAMKDFTLRFEADPAQANPLAAGLVAAGGTELRASMVEDWEDQTVTMVGGQYMLTPNFALRAGASHSTNPVPERDLNPLFPAIIKTHYTVGFGWRAGRAHSVSASMSISPKVTQTNPDTGITASHRQQTFRVNYNYSY
jgi:long-chain fatty acid transport protein